MHTGKSYDCRNAVIAACLAMAKDIDKDPDLRALLAEHTDIPEARLDFATSELRQLLFGLKQMVRLFRLLSENEEALRDAIERTVGEGTAWTDDDKRDLTVNAYAETADEGEPLVTVKTKLKKGGDE